MNFGFEVPTSGVFAGADNLARVAKHGEQIGFDYLHIGDHLVVPRSIQSSYPYSDSGAFLGEWSSKERGKMIKDYISSSLLHCLI